jgi:hypothetical protein
MAESIESLLQRPGESQKQQVRDRDLKEQQALQQHRQQQFRSQALDWLKKLDPLSTEGLWFNSFAEGNGDRLEVAIEYLAALQSIDPNQTIL